MLGGVPPFRTASTFLTLQRIVGHNCWVEGREQSAALHHRASSASPLADCGSATLRSALPPLPSLGDDGDALLYPVGFPPAARHFIDLLLRHSPDQRLGVGGPLGIVAGSTRTPVPTPPAVSAILRVDSTGAPRADGAPSSTSSLSTSTTASVPSGCGATIDFQVLLAHPFLSGDEGVNSEEGNHTSVSTAHSPRHVSWTALSAAACEISSGSGTDGAGTPRIIDDTAFPPRSVERYRLLHILALRRRLHTVRQRLPARANYDDVLLPPSQLGTEEEVGGAGTLESASPASVASGDGCASLRFVGLEEVFESVDRGGVSAVSSNSANHNPSSPLASTSSDSSTNSGTSRDSPSISCVPAPPTSSTCGHDHTSSGRPHPDLHSHRWGAARLGEWGWGAARLGEWGPREVISWNIAPRMYVTAAEIRERAAWYAAAAPLPQQPAARTPLPSRERNEEVSVLESVSPSSAISLHSGAWLAPASASASSASPNPPSSDVATVSHTPPVHPRVVSRASPTASSSARVSELAVGGGGDNAAGWHDVSGQAWVSPHYYVVLSNPRIPPEGCCGGEGRRGPAGGGYGSSGSHCCAGGEELGNIPFGGHSPNCGTAQLRAFVAAVNTLRPPPRAVLVIGQLAASSSTAAASSVSATASSIRVLHAELAGLCPHGPTSIIVAGGGGRDDDGGGGYSAAAEEHERGCVSAAASASLAETLLLMPPAMPSSRSLPSLLRDMDTCTGAWTSGVRMLFVDPTAVVEMGPGATSACTATNATTATTGGTSAPSAAATATDTTTAAADSSAATTGTPAATAASTSAAAVSTPSGRTDGDRLQKTQRQSRHAAWLRSELELSTSSSQHSLLVLRRHTAPERVLKGSAVGPALVDSNVRMMIMPAEYTETERLGDSGGGGCSDVFPGEPPVPGHCASNEKRGGSSVAANLPAAAAATALPVKSAGVRRPSTPPTSSSTWSGSVLYISHLRDTVSWGPAPQSRDSTCGGPPRTGSDGQGPLRTAGVALTIVSATEFALTSGRHFAEVAVELTLKLE